MLVYNGAVYREALQAPEEPRGPRFYPAPRANPPGPTLTQQDFVELGQMSKQEFVQRAADLADKMISQCRRGKSPAWCIAANGVMMGRYDDETLALKVVEHWLFLKSRMPNRQVHMGTWLADLAKG
jgi:hypothetical protein